MNSFRELHKKLCSLSIQELRQKISSAGMPADVRRITDTTLEALEARAAIRPAPSMSETSLAYVGYLASLPWSRTTGIKPDLKAVDEMLREHVIDIGSRQKIQEHLSSRFSDNLKKPTILVVDDERIALESLSYILEKEDYRVVTAGSGAEAITRLGESDIDLVITDLIMGEIDGTAIIKETISRYPDTRVIMITGYATVDTAVQALRMGAFHYIEKPVRVDDLLSAVKDALRHTYANGRRNVLCFEGQSPETHISLGRKIAGVLNRKFAVISLSEIKEEAEILGLGRSAEDAGPGCIIDEIRRADSADPVIMLQGMDDAVRGFSGDIASVLMEVISPLRNRNFTDRYLEVPFDLSKVIFILSAGSAETIQSPLADILDVVRL